MSYKFLRKTCAAIAIAGLLSPGGAFAQSEEEQVTLAPPSSDLVKSYTLPIESSPSLTHEQKLELLRKKIKYVFVLFQENRSFDFYFGTYPGANGLFSQKNALGFGQPIVLASGAVSAISPFRIPQSVTGPNNTPVPIYPEDIQSVNHAHKAIDEKLGLDANHVAHNDRYAFTEEGVTGALSADGKTYTGPAPGLAQVQIGELVMGHVDCDTAPFLWTYADRFTLFDNFFDTVIGPSTPNAIAMIAGQSGETQWVKHPDQAAAGGVPVTSDPQPYWGSAEDVHAHPKQPVDNPSGVSTSPALNLTFATLPLSFMGGNIRAITARDNDPVFDLLDVQADIAKIAGDKTKPVNWAWYQDGYDHEPTDPAGATTNHHYIAHHNAPQYFGYEANNPAETAAHLKGLGDFYTAIKNNALPPDGGVFYVRGGYGNLDGLTPRAPSPAVKAAFAGNDDHPGYSDTQISEALLADSINAIAASKYWPESAIIITYDESDGLFDHAQPKVRSFDPAGNALDQGPRIPTILISPYAKVHAVSHEALEHGSVIRFIDELFHLTPLADLPDERNARARGLATYGQAYLGPSDDLTPGVGDMFSGFDNARLLGKQAPLPPRFAEIERKQVITLPHFQGQGCRALQITPTDLVSGVVIDPAPRDFNPRPSTNPGTPATTPGWPTD